MGFLPRPHGRCIFVFPLEAGGFLFSPRSGWVFVFSPRLGWVFWVVFFPHAPGEGFYFHTRRVVGCFPHMAGGLFFCPCGQRGVFWLGWFFFTHAAGVFSFYFPVAAGGFLYFPHVVGGLFFFPCGRRGVFWVGFGSFPTRWVGFLGGVFSPGGR